MTCTWCKVYSMLTKVFQMQVFLQIFPRYLCSHGLAATAWFWQPYCQPGSWGPVSSLGGVFWPSCTPLRLPRQEHTAGSGILGFLARQMLKHHANRAQGCGSQSPINWGVFCQEPECYGRQWTLSGDIAKGLCAEGWQTATLEHFWDLIVLLFQN